MKVPGMRFGTARGKAPLVERLTLGPDAFDELADPCRELLSWHVQRRARGNLSS